MPRAAALPPDERRAQILDAVAPVIREHGRQASTRQLAEAAGVAEGTLFRVFSSKDELIGAVVERYLGAGRTLDRIDLVDRSLPLAERLGEIVAILVSRSAETFEILHAIGPPKEPSTEDRIAFRDHMLEQARQIDLAVTRLLEPDAELLVVSPAQLAELVGAMVFAVSNPMLRRFRGNQPMRISEQPESIVDLVLHGCLVDSTRTAPGFDHGEAEAAAARAAAGSTATDPCSSPVHASPVHRAVNAPVNTPANTPANTPVNTPVNTSSTEPAATDAAATAN